MQSRSIYLYGHDTTLGALEKKPMNFLLTISSALNLLQYSLPPVKVPSLPHQAGRHCE